MGEHQLASLQLVDENRRYDLRPGRASTSSLSGSGCRPTRRHAVRGPISRPCIDDERVRWWSLMQTGTMIRPIGPARRGNIRPSLTATQWGCRDRVGCRFRSKPTAQGPVRQRTQTCFEPCASSPIGYPRRDNTLNQKQKGGPHGPPFPNGKLSETIRT
jgi:hypothetical protein